MYLFLRSWILYIWLGKTFEHDTRAVIEWNMLRIIYENGTVTLLLYLIDILTRIAIEMIWFKKCTLDTI